MVLASRIHTTVQNSKTPEEAKVRSKIHQEFMMEVINKQAEEGRMYMHEFVEGAESIKCKECIHTRTMKGNIEAVTGKWSVRGENKGEAVRRHLSRSKEQI